MSDLTFQDLRVHYGTGRAYTISGQGRNRVMGYRTGKQCDAGDIETREWCALVKEAIERAGEQQLFRNLLEYLKERNYAKASKTELEEKALELHASRIFDNQLWVCFLDFNQAYRPELLENIRLVLIVPECCKKPGYITYARFENAG